MKILDVKVLVDPYKVTAHNFRKSLFGYDKIEKVMKEEKAKEYHSSTLQEIFDI